MRLLNLVCAASAGSNVRNADRRRGGGRSAVAPLAALPTCGPTARGAGCRAGAAAALVSSQPRHESAALDAAAASSTLLACAASHVRFAAVSFPSHWHHAAVRRPIRPQPHRPRPRHTRCAFSSKGITSCGAWGRHLQVNGGSSFPPEWHD
eukprot:SAG31_NODE_646_length_13223_cov_14.088845_12_plen_151_part_00